MKKSLLRALRALCTYFIWICTAIIFFPLCLLFALLPARIRYTNPVYFLLTSWWNRILLRSAGVRAVVHIDGDQEQVLTEPAVIVSNHPSTLDVSLLESLLGDVPRMWLAKKEYTAIPVAGFVLRRMHIVIDRESSRASAVALNAALRLLEQTGAHVIAFPEGTRQADGNIHAFHHGFALIAKKLQRPVVCIGIFGAHEVLPKGAWAPTVWSSRVDLVISPEFRYTDYTSEEAFVSSVHAWFVAQHKKYNV